MNTTESRGARIATLVAALCAGVGLTACADKGFTPPQRAFSPKVSLQITTFASQQSSFGPRWLLVAALYAVAKRDSSGRQTGDDVRLLSYKWAPFVQGTQQVTLAVDVSPCLADTSRLGTRDGCSMYVGAGLLKDTFNLRDSTNADPRERSFDFAFPVGPFIVGPGRAPTIPPIDLSATHFGVVGWEVDNALRLGGADIPFFPTGNVTGIATAGGGVTLVLPTRGVVYPGAANQPPIGSFAQLAFFEGGTWRRATATMLSLNGGGSAFTAVAAFAVNDVYAAHRSGLYHFDGAGFKRIATIGDSLFAVAVVGGAGGKYVIAGAGNGAVWIGNTQTWTRYSLGTTQRIDGVCITGPNEAFASSTSGGGLWHFDGNSWISAPAPSGAAKFALQCPGPGQAFVLGFGQSGGMFRWNGSGWSQMPTTGLNPGRLITWGVVSPTEIYASGDSATIDRAFYRFDGTAWTEVGRRRVTQQSGFFTSVMWADPRGGSAYLASPFGRVERVTATSTSVLSYEPSMRDVIVTSPTSAFAVGWNLFLARWDGAKWTVDVPPPGTPALRVLQGVWSDGPSNAWAVGGVNTILRYNGTAWNVVSDALRPIARTDNYNAVWGSGSNVWIVGDNTVLRCGNAGNATGCVNEAGGAGALYSIWGTSDGTAKYAVGAGGRIVKSTGGGTWQAMTSPTSRTLVRVSGSSANDVWAVGDSVLVHYDGTAWTNVPMTGDLYSLQSHTPLRPQEVAQLGLWVRSADEAYLGSQDGGIARYDGRTKIWRQISNTMFGRRFLSISGAVGGCALAVTEAQSDRPSATLWRGVGPTGCFSSPMTAPTNWP